MKTLKQEITNITLKNGLKVHLLSDINTNEHFVNIAVNFGSIDLDVNNTKLPLGTAHFLEHVMFAKKDGDYFEDFNKNGANSNAYTSYNHTLYQFSCIDKIIDNFNLLMDMVTTLTITNKTIKKEYLIIKEELNMYNQIPEEKLKSMQMKQLIKTTNYKYDIGGTTNTIEDINITNLEMAFNKFYKIVNMDLFIYSPMKIDKQLEMINNYFSKKNPPIKYEKFKKLLPLEYEKFNLAKEKKIYDSKCNTIISTINYPIKESLTIQELISLKAYLHMKFSTINNNYNIAVKKKIINNSFNYDVITYKNCYYITFTCYLERNCNSYIKFVKDNISNDTKINDLTLGIKKLQANELRKYNNKKKSFQNLIYEYYLGIDNEEYLNCLFDIKFDSFKSLVLNKVNKQPHISSIFPPINKI